MYDVLAYTLEIDGRPEEEVERAMLSAVDLRGTDAVSLLITAKYLAMLGAHRAAIKIYQQAAAIEPTRPEPYVLGLQAARQLKDYDALQWAVVGILTNAWTKDRVRRHRDAEDAALDAVTALEKAGQTPRAKQLREAVNEAKRRDLIITLEWNGEGDLDLVVDEPFKTTCSSEQPLSAGGGVLVHDGLGGKSKDCVDEYICVRGGSGQYQVRINHRAGNIVGKQCRLTIVRHAGSPAEQTEKLTVPIEQTSKPIAVSLLNGRRKEVGPLPFAEPQAARRLTHRNFIAQMTHRATGMPSFVAHQFAQGNAGFGTVRPVASGQQRFGVGYQPVISVVQEGITLSAAAVVSGDRRYVRIALSPAFNSVIEIASFSFQ